MKTRLSALALAAALLAGCASSTTPNYDMQFGNALRQAKQRQTLNPQASATNTDPVAGMDGRTARDGIVLYQGTFKAPPPVVNVINIGGQIGQGGGTGR